MKDVLLLVSPVAEAAGALEVALQRALRDGARLIAAVVLDPDLTHRVDTALANVGFVGEKLGASVVDALAREQRSLAEERLREIDERCRRAGVPCTTQIEEGATDEICAQLIRAHDVGFAVLAAEKRSWLTRLLSRSAAVRLPAFAGCEVQVIDH